MPSCPLSWLTPTFQIDVGSFGLRPHPRAVAVIAHGAPVRVRDAQAAQRIRRPAVGVVVLNAAADVIRIVLVVADAIDLREHHVEAPVPRLAAVDRDRRAAVVRFDDAPAVARDPQAVMVLMHGALDVAIGLAAVARLDEILGREEDVIGVRRIDREPAHVEGPLIRPACRASSAASARRRRRSATARRLSIGSARRRDVARRRRGRCGPCIPRAARCRGGDATSRRRRST